MRALQWNFGKRHDLALALPVSKENLAAADKRTFFYFFFPTEPEQLCFRAVGESRGGRVVGVEDCEIVRLLILEDSGLRINIICEGLVAVKVIGRDVQYDGDSRPKADDRLQLKA